MSKRVTIYGKEVNLINRFQDGSTREDMEGFVLKYEGNEQIYATIGDIIHSIAKREYEKYLKTGKTDLPIEGLNTENKD